jgi:fatty-acyl-CoA synthase
LSDYKDKISTEDLKQYMLGCAEAGKIPKYGVPDRYIFVEEIPKTSVGKINKMALRKEYA